MIYSRKLSRHLHAFLGDTIREQRVMRRMPLHRLATLSGVPLSRLDEYEVGKYDMRLSDLLRIACALGVEVAALLPGASA